MIPISQNSSTQLPPTPLWSTSFLSLGFRPFFLGSLATAAIILPLWVLTYLQIFKLPVEAFPPIDWHAHEMIFGFAVAAIAGFLLTASSNWTGIRTIHGSRLLILFLLWFAPRLMPFFPGVSRAWLSASDLLFLPVLTIVFVGPIVKSGNFRNYLFVYFFTGLFVCNILFHLRTAGYAEITINPLYAAVYIIVLLMSLISGRVLPFFTSRAIRDAKPHAEPMTETMIVATTIASLTTTLLELPSYGMQPLWVALLVTTAGLHIRRMQNWGALRNLKQIARIPMLWILYLGYAFIPLGFILLALHFAGLVARSPATHAFTAGAMGILIMGFIARVSLGHTGRPIVATAAHSIAFISIVLASIFRVFGPLTPLVPATFLTISAVLWIFAYTTILLAFIPILCRPRADGRVY